MKEKGRKTLFVPLVSAQKPLKEELQKRLFARTALDKGRKKRRFCGCFCVAFKARGKLYFMRVKNRFFVEDETGRERYSPWMRSPFFALYEGEEKACPARPRGVLRGTRQKTAASQETEKRRLPISKPRSFAEAKRGKLFPLGLEKTWVLPRLPREKICFLREREDFLFSV